MELKAEENEVSAKLIVFQKMLAACLTVICFKQEKPQHVSKVNRTQTDVECKTHGESG